MASAFYSNEEAVFERSTDVSIDAVRRTPLNEIESVYEIERCVQYIKDHRCVNVALQFPDLLLADSQWVAKELEKRSQARIYILADTSYGHCDIDEVNANHITADLIIHYGEASLSPSATIPTLFVFGRLRSLSSLPEVRDAFIKAFPNKNKTRVVFLHHVMCSSMAASVADALIPDYPYLSVAQLNIPLKPGGAKNPKVGPEEKNILKELCTKACPGCPCRLKEGEGDKMGDGPRDPKTAHPELELNKNEDNASSKSNEESSDLEPKIDSADEDAGDLKSEPMEIGEHRPDCKDFVTGCFTIPLEDDKDLSDYSIFYLGPKNSESLRNLMLEHLTIGVHVYDPVKRKCEEMPRNLNRQLMKRYYLVEKAKDAKIVGVIAGTMGVSGYLECINHMKRITKLAGKKSYTFIVGKLNPAKLANFMEIDIFVLVANPENNFLDSSDFYRPIITPYEFEVACNPNREWTGEYITDFRRILPGGPDYIEFPADFNSVGDESGTTMSLVTGSIRSTENDEGPGSNPGAGVIAPRNENTDLAVFGADSSAHRMTERTWKGLEMKLGETRVEKAKTGRSGLAVSYNERIDF